MNTSPTLSARVPLLVAAALLFLAPAVALGQAYPFNVFVGNYKGTAKAPSGNFDFGIEIKSDNGKLHGSLVTPKGEQSFTSAEASNMTLKIKLGPDAKPEILTLQMRDGKLVGDWKVGKETRTVELERVVVVPPTTPAPDLLSGEWDAAADAQGQAFPFTLTLKVDGEKVTGSSSSQLGESTISTGSWKEGKLAVILDGGNGQVALIATLVDGKLVGDYDYNGQLQGKWLATKKKQ